MANNYEREINPSLGREFWRQEKKRKERKRFFKKRTRYVLLILGIIQNIRHVHNQEDNTTLSQSFS